MHAARTSALVGLFCLCVIGTALADETADRDKANKEELARLQGRWKVVAFTKSGQQDLDELVKLGLLFTFKDDSLTVTADREGFTPQNQMLRLDATTTPKLLDFAESAKAFEEHKKVYEGVYSLDGDTFQWCFNLDGDQPAKANRPAAVESKADSSTILIKLERLRD
jgi:uncharacterized protein (TIGR03067 family)